MFVLFVSEPNKFLLNFSSQKLTLPAVHFCPITSPPFSTAGGLNPMNKILFYAGKC